jgi:2-amino-4-hydroxy-6-hydroxymethyldihydropteridine diphosphokinase
MTGVLAYIGLGSNLEQPLDQLQRALTELHEIPRSRLLASSSLYLSSPMGPTDQPDYVNSVVALDTELPPLDLLDQLQRIEQAHGRERGLRWGPRTLDLDLLLYGDQLIQNDRLSVPHPGTGERDFVLLPLAELAPELEIPGLGAISDVLSACTMKSACRINPASPELSAVPCKA